MALAEGAVRAGAAGSSGSNRSSSMPMSSLLLAAEAAERRTRLNRGATPVSVQYYM
jgi:hypothetical protein